jgi:uncharacterized protein DUF4411
LAIYWLDSNVFIQAKQGPYAFDLAPGFWKHLEIHFMAGSIVCPLMVYTELCEFEDELKLWVQKLQKGKTVFLTPCEAAQKKFSEIANWVQATYRPAHAASFLSGADPWLVAQAAIHKGIIVTQESLVPINSHQAKIPNTCQRFSVQYIDLYTFLRKLKMKLS